MLELFNMCVVFLENGTMTWWVENTHCQRKQEISCSVCVVETSSRATAEIGGIHQIQIDGEHVTSCITV